MSTRVPRNAKATAVVWAFIACAAVTWCAHIARPILSEPLRSEVTALVHVADLVLMAVILGGLIVFKFWVKPRLSPEVAGRVRAAEERERNRSSGPVLRATVVLLGLGVAVGALLKYSGLVADKRVLYVCVLAVPPLLVAGWFAIRVRRRRGL